MVYSVQQLNTDDIGNPGNSSKQECDMYYQDHDDGSTTNGVQMISGILPLQNVLLLHNCLHNYFTFQNRCDRSTYNRKPFQNKNILQILFCNVLLQNI